MFIFQTWDRPFSHGFPQLQVQREWMHGSNEYLNASGKLFSYLWMNWGIYWKRFLPSRMNFNLDVKRLYILIKECFFTAKECCAWSFKANATGQQNVERVSVCDSVKDGAKTFNAKLLLPLPSVVLFASLIRKSWHGKNWFPCMLLAVSNRPAREECSTPTLLHCRRTDWVCLKPSFELRKNVDWVKTREVLCRHTLIE